MPELPEVETLRRQMERALVGRKIRSVEVRFGGRIRPSSSALIKAAAGASFKSFGRRAKLLLSHLSNGWTIITHLKMTGSYLLKKAGETPTKHAHVVFHLDKKEDLHFEDVRKFGYLKIIKTKDLEKEIFDKEGYGPEPLDPSFTFTRFKMCLTSRPNKKIKPLLMEQSRIAGIGNIYADEACWYGKVHPERTVGSLTEKELKGAYQGVLKSLRESVKRLGTSSDDYRDLYGKKGGNVPHLWVYGRDGEKCRRCGTKLKKIWVAQRGAHYCPKCQKPPQEPVTLRMRNARPGFTLIELLATTTIIGLLAVVGTASYSYVRSKARDARRVSDMRTIRNAIETYFEQNGKYPPAPSEGLILGSEEAKMISDAGITTFGGEKGILYLQNAPFNVLPNGVPYHYRSKHSDGSLCSFECFRYEVAFALETQTGELAGGPHLLTEEGIEGEETGASGVSGFAALRQYVPSAGEVAAALGTAQETAELARQLAGRTDVQTANKALVAPVALAGSIASFVAALATALPFANAGQFFILVIAQPYLFLTRRKRQGWGTVYHAGTKVPIDLATIRLVEAGTNRPVATKVTDKDGRFAFTPPVGTYRLEAVKPDFAFPSVSLASVTDDGSFTDIYHGNLIEVTEGGKTLTVNVPMDPTLEPEAEARTLLSVRNKKAIRKVTAAAGPLLGLVAFAVSPGPLMLIVFLVQLFLYQLFKRLAEPEAPKSQGTVYDIDTRKPIVQAVVRILSLPYHKVLESRLTDSEGRYSFHVGAGTYYLIAIKPGYGKTETDPIDFTKIDKPAWVASDLPMRKSKESGNE